MSQITKDNNITKASNTKQTPKERAQELLSKMTLKEKAGQLAQSLYGFQCYERKGEEIILSQEFKEEVERCGGLGVLYGLYRADPWAARDYENGLYGKEAIRAYNQVQKYIIEHSRLGIPMLLSTECPHGHQALDGYLLPVNLGVGASFDPDLLQSAGGVCSTQLHEMGVDMALVSMLDVLRDPRWGRSEECYGEDPVLCAKLAKAMVTGMQEAGTEVVAKHFAAQGEGTGGINASAARIGERELREIHLPPMEACCQAGVQGVMAAYNEIDGIYCHANPKLLKGILREEMGFDGIVMADGVAIDQLNNITGDYKASGALALNSGVDVGLWDKSFTKLEEAVNAGEVDEETLNNAVLRVLTMKFKRGLFENPYLEEEKERTNFSHQQYPQALQLARESIILLKNEKEILPLNNVSKENEINKKNNSNNINKIAVIGPNADSIYNQMGDYTPKLKSGKGVTVLQGIKQLIKEDQIKDSLQADTQLSPSISLQYAQGCETLTGSQTMKQEAIEIASQSEIVILVLGGSSSRFGLVDFDTNGAAVAKDSISMDCGEGVDTADLRLPLIQRELFQSIVSLGKPVITIIISGRPMVLTEIEQSSQALIQSFYPGEMGGQAIAEILFGKISPSGHLPVSMPRHTGQLPVYYNYKSSYQAWNYYDQDKQPLYTFGQGLSYTQYSCTDIHLESETISLDQLQQQGINLKCQIQNTGNYDSSAVLMLYLHHEQCTAVPRIRELKNFKRINLSKGEKVQDTISLNYSDLAIWDSSMNHVVEKGKIILYLQEGGKDIWSGEVRIS